MMSSELSKDSVFAPVHTAILDGNKITCPCCSAAVEIIKPVATGAGYMKDKIMLTPEQIGILKWWMRSPYQTGDFTKFDLHAKYLEDPTNSPINQNPWNARISELCHPHCNCIIKGPEVKSEPTVTKKSPTYALNIPRVTWVLEHHGSLKNCNCPEHQDERWQTGRNGI